MPYAHMRCFLSPPAQSGRTCAMVGAERGHEVNCTYCDADTRVRETTHQRAPGGLTTTVRSRICKSVPPHRFKTVERAVSLTIHEVLVRRSGDRQLAEGPFDTQRLCRDVSNGVLKRLDEDQVHDVVRRALADLEATLASKVHPLAPDEALARPGYVHAIMDTDIGHAVERRLRSRVNRLPHVLYALSTFGRSNRQGRRGFVDARGVLSWMAHPDNYPDLGVHPLPEKLELEAVRWRPLHSHFVPPKFVIKRDHIRRRQFGNEQFVASVRRAMIGRPNAEKVTERVAHCVLEELSGQREVLSSQLAAGVLSVLRRVDDIAYLRWAAVAKGMTSVTDFRDEAVSLLTHPGPRLDFT